ncbi:MAG: 23S rRNA (pseudouridine(1915)-N(3))-methyltransferase RlmH [Bacteroidales bacterium]|nr:23S rRNA (pseudouridine(1915)-N(3))-methyltransferase RlmH [Bacteroidales bacterium]
MKIILLVIGKTDKKWLQEAILEYKTRINRYISFEIKELPDVKNAASLPDAIRKKKEGELLMPYLSDCTTIVTDEKGSEMRSVEFSKWINKNLISGGKNLCFVIGGPYGYPDEIYECAQEKISLSKMTFSHQMVRLIFVEQLYRAFTILNREPYHHE